MNEKPDIIAIGESLIELSTNKSMMNAECLDKYYGGDTLTTAIAALRLGSKTGFISRIGMDAFRNYLLESWQNEGLDISHVKPCKGVNGIYLISKTDDLSANEFSYYRKKTAATNLSADDIPADYIKDASILYATGITQSLSLSAREAVKKAFMIAKENHVLTAYDPNFTSKIWSEDEAKEALYEIIEYIDIIFLNDKYDSKIVIDSESVDKITKFLWDKGISTVFIKSSADKGYYASWGGKTEFIPYFDNKTTDDTGAGDTFNGAVLHGLVSGMTPFKSAALGAVASGLQIQNYGAVKSIPYKEEVYKIFKGQDE